MNEQQIDIGEWSELPDGAILLEIPLNVGGVCMLEANIMRDDVEEAEYEIIESSINEDRASPCQ